VALESIISELNHLNTDEWEVLGVLTYYDEFIGILR